MPNPIIVPDSYKITPDDSLDSPWMRLGHEDGLNLTAPRTPEHENDQRTPEPTVQLKENAPAARSRQTSAKKKGSSTKQKRKAPSPSKTFTTKKPRKSRITPSKRTRSVTPSDDSSYRSGESHVPPPLPNQLPKGPPGRGPRGRLLTRHFIITDSYKNSDARYQDRIQSSSDLDDDYHAEKVGDSSTKEAYQYGARDDDAEDEYAVVYEGDDQGAKMRRY